MFGGWRASSTPRDTLAPKSQTTSPTTTRFQRFCRGGLHLGHHAASSRGFTAAKRGELHYMGVRHADDTRPEGFMSCKSPHRVPSNDIPNAQKAPAWRTMKPTAPLHSPQQGTVETAITTAPEKHAKNAHFSPAKVIAVSIPHRNQRAKATGVSGNRATWSTGPGCGARARRQRNRHPNFARNLSRSFFETPQKRCNSNDTHSMFE